MYSVEHDQTKQKFNVLNTKGALVQDYKYNSQIRNSEERARCEARDHCNRMNNLWCARAA